MQKKAIVMVLLVFVTACSVVKKEAPIEDIDKASALFFERLANAEYDKIYKDSAGTFKKNNPQSQVYETLKQMTEMGKPSNQTRLTMTFEKQDGKRVAMPSYSVYFDTHRATVVLRLIDEEGEWRLGGYEVKQRAG